MIWFDSLVQWRLQSDAGEKASGRLLSGRQESTQRASLFTCVRDFILSIEKHFLDYCCRKQQKMLANKDNSCSSLYLQLTVRILPWHNRSGEIFPVHKVDLQHATQTGIIRNAAA